MDANREVELKLAVSHDALKELGQAAVQAGAKSGGEHGTVRSVYFDTGRHRLHEGGYELCIRHNGGSNSVQTVKALNPVDRGLWHDEWETEMHGNRPLAEAARNSPLSKLLRKPGDWKKLRPVFTVKVDRNTYLLERDDATIEIALDDGALRHKRTEHSIVEAELELKKGAPRALFAFAREISAAVPSMVSLTSKGERGYRLVAGEASHPTASLVFALQRDMSTAQGIRAIGLTCLAALFDNLAILVEGGGIDALHQSRVCVRRLRAIVSLFAPALDWQDDQAMRAELKWLCDLLGDVRELDVFIKSVLEPGAAANPDVPGFKPLLAAFKARRERIYTATVDQLRSPRMSGLSLELVARFDGLPTAGPPGSKAQRRRETLIRRFAAKQLRRRLRSLLNDSNAIELLKPEEQHRIRIRAKRLRYMAEPFADVIDWKRFGDVVSSLHEIQDALGELNDYKVNRAMALAYATEVLAAGTGEPSSVLAAGVAAAGGKGDAATALEKATTARDRLARVPALRLE